MNFLSLPAKAVVRGMGSSSVEAAGKQAAEPLLSPDSELASNMEQHGVEPTPLLFFDGHCNLCNFFVNMFLKLDAGSDPVRVKLASLQSPEV